MLQPRHTLRRGLDPSPWRLVRFAAPSALPVTAAEVKDHGRVDTDAEDDLVTAYIEAATRAIDGAEGWLGRCLVEQTWDLKLDWFPSDDRPILIPLAPLLSIEQITYTDEAGATQTLASSVYQVVGIGSNMPGYVLEAHEQSWPATRDIPEAITIRFKAGYAADDSVSPSDPRGNIPPPIKVAIYHMVSDLYEMRGAKDVSAAQIRFADRREPLSPIAQALLSTYRVGWFA